MEGVVARFRSSASMAATMFLLLLAGPLWAGSLPFEIQLPTQCKMKEVKTGTWICNYVSEDGHNRRIVLDFHEYVLKPQAADILRKMSSEERRIAFSDEIARIDKYRDSHRPPGDYHRPRYEFLVEGNCPVGFMACVRSLDDMTIEGSNIRNDRASLHCLAARPDAKAVTQLLFSLIEFNPARSVQETGLEPEFDRIIASIDL